MPHSSGGGSHSSSSHSSHSSSHSYSSGGGSHSSGYHSSSYSSSYSSYSSRSYGGSSYERPKRTSGPRVSKKKFSGADRYVYYRDNKPVYVYSNIASYKPEKHLGRLWIYIPILLFLLLDYWGLMQPPLSLRTDYDHRIVIEQPAVSLGDTAGLEASMQAFFERTGIAPAVITVHNEEWNGYYDRLEYYAYDIYVNRFDDERHWLLVYSEPREPDPAFLAWYWEGMQGDETDKILTDSVTDRFTQITQRELTRANGQNVGQAFANAFNEITPDMLTEPEGTPEDLWTARILIVVVTALGLFRTGIVRFKKRPKELPKEASLCTERTEEVTCDYCGGIFLDDRHNCPHCGAARTKKA